MTYWYEAGTRVPDRPDLGRPMLQVSPRNGKWMNAGAFPLDGVGRLQVDMKRLRKLAAQRDKRYGAYEANVIQQAGHLLWYMRGKIRETGFHGRAFPLLLDFRPPTVRIVAPAGVNPSIDDRGMLEEPVAVARGNTTLVAEAYDEVGFGQTLMDFTRMPPRSAIEWTLLHEATGETTTITSLTGSGYAGITSKVKFDFSEKPGLYLITVTAEDCVGNRSQTSTRVLGL